MAPEIMSETQVPGNAACDVHSLGITMWHIFSRRVWLAGLPLNQNRFRTAAVIQNIKTSHMRPDPLPTIPRELNHLMACCWQVMPSARPSSADVLKRLQEIRQRMGAVVCEVYDIVPEHGWGDLTPAVSVPVADTGTDTDMETTSSTITNSETLRGPDN